MSIHQNRFSFFSRNNLHTEQSKYFNNNNDSLEKFEGSLVSSENEYVIKSCISLGNLFAEGSLDGRICLFNIDFKHLNLINCTLQKAFDSEIEFLRLVINNKNDSLLKDNSALSKQCSSYLLFSIGKDNLINIQDSNKIKNSDLIDEADFSKNGIRSKLKLWKIEPSFNQDTRLISNVSITNNNNFKYSKLNEFNIFPKKSNEISITCFDLIMISDTNDTSLSEKNICLGQHNINVAVGLNNGAVLLFDNIFVRRKSKTKRRYLRHEGTRCTGLHFMIRKSNNNVNEFLSVNKLEERQNAYMIYLFVVDFESVSIYAFHPKQKTIQSLVKTLDNIGCDINCSSLASQAQNIEKEMDYTNLVIGTKDACYFYDYEEKRQCFAFEREKKFVLSFRNYLAVTLVSIENDLHYNLTIYDIRNRLIAFQGNFDNVINIFYGVDSNNLVNFYIRTLKNVYMVSEKNFDLKLKMLLRKKYFQTALNFVEQEKCSPKDVIIARIHQLYGDQLCKNSDFENAVEHFVLTLGYLSPEQVIRKFIDSKQSAENMCLYLENAIAVSFSSINLEELTKKQKERHKRRKQFLELLLIACQTKLGRLEKIDDFIRSQDRMSFDDQTEYNISLIIDICLQAKYYEQALYITERFKFLDQHLEILMDCVKKPIEAILFVKLLPFNKAIKAMDKYGTNFADSLPNETVDILNKLCCDKQENVKNNDESNNENVKLESKYNDKNNDKIQIKPQKYFTLFAERNKNKYLIEFIEYLMANSIRRLLDPIVFDTLLDAYFYQYAEEDVLLEDSEKKIMILLKDNNVKYNSNFALALAKSANFENALIYLYEKLHLYEEVFFYFCDLPNRHQDVMKTCKKYSEIDSSLIVKALYYFVNLSSENCYNDEIFELVTLIENFRLLSPIKVLEIVSNNPNLELSVLKNYIRNSFTEQLSIIESDQSEIINYSRNTELVQKEILNLKDKSKIFQIDNCCICSTKLDLPSVHFMCMHSYHQRCLNSVGYKANNINNNDDNNYCPLCEPENRKFFEMKKSMVNSFSSQDTFFRKLNTSFDGFSIISEYFGRGLFDNLDSTYDETDDVLL